ncbi:MAG TPA: phosphate ABC transporter permease subunit PstC [Polyangiaceae bacterium]|nr:phosphate ABC transporter permease subunit PstC [Polyangiaceae bacterium]
MQVAATASSERAALASRVRGQSKRLSERMVEILLVVSGLISVFTTLGILYVLASETAQFFTEVSLFEFLSGTEWTPLFADAHFGILPLLTGTLLTSGIALGVALPFGLMSAIYLSEFAPSWVRRTLKPTLELLAGVPTIVYGYFALVFLTPLLQTFLPGLSGFNALSAGIVMGIMIIPTISSLSEDALSAVPSGLREAAYGLGATKLSSIFRVVLPAATSGVAASVILGLSRAIGETMIVAIAAGQQPRFTLDPRVPIETMTTYIVQISMGDVPAGTREYRTIFAVGSALFVLTFLMNALSQRLARRFRER